jgi:hypothetical protein
MKDFKLNAIAALQPGDFISDAQLAAAAGLDDPRDLLLELAAGRLPKRPPTIIVGAVPYTERHAAEMWIDSLPAWRAAQPERDAQAQRIAAERQGAELRRVHALEANPWPDPKDASTLHRAKLKADGWM